MHSNGSPLLVAQRSNSTTDQLMRPPFRKPDAGPPPRSAVGFLLLDGSLRPIVFNAEAIRVLSYPDPPANVRRPDVFLAGKIRESLLSLDRKGREAEYQRAENPEWKMPPEQARLSEEEKRGLLFVSRFYPDNPI